MVSMLIALVFAVGGLMAAAALVLTWRCYRSVALGNIAALRCVEAERSFDFRMGGHPALVGSVVIPWPAGARGGRARRSTAAAGLRAAA